ncbi:TPA: hypothetical protein OQU49_004325 [Shigella flexneri]|nr:hypothetical protein [Shigella flexneri]
MAKRSAKQFARLDLDYADNPKIADLSDAAFRTHIEMVLYSRKYLTDGRIPARTATRWDTDSVSELLLNDPEAPSLAKMDDGSYLLHGFEDMQETKAEVQARQQVNARNGAKGGRPKTQSVTESPTPAAKPSVKQRREEEEKTSSAPKRASKLPDSWTPTPEHRAQAEASGIDSDLEATKLRDWALSKGESRKDWDATFRNWLRNARPTPGYGPTLTLDPMKDW